MSGLRLEARAFGTQKQDEVRHAAQGVAFFLATGIDLDAALADDLSGRQRALMRVERLLERERLRGCARHWSYDLNRHVALKGALDALRATLDVSKADGCGRASPVGTAKKNAAP